jgi:ATP-dependent Clp protease protease subunit
MIHQVATGFSGPATHIKVMAERTMRLQQRLIALLAEFTGQPSGRIEEDLERDCFLTADQAVAYGLVDTVLEPFPRDAK